MEKPYIIGITGGSGSGKTSFIKALKQSFSKEEICFLSQDDYYLTNLQKIVTDYGIPLFMPASSSVNLSEKQDSLWSRKSSKRRRRCCLWIRNDAEFHAITMES